MGSYVVLQGHAEQQGRRRTQHQPGEAAVKNGEGEKHGTMPGMDDRAAQQKESLDEQGGPQGMGVEYPDITVAQGQGCRPDKAAGRGREKPAAHYLHRGIEGSRARKNGQHLQMGQKAFAKG